MKNNNEISVKEVGFLTAGIDFANDYADDMDGITPSFERIRIPSGGSLAFELPGEDPENPDIAKEFSAVIVYHHPINVYYKEKFDGNNNPPDCSSMDGKTGINNETGEICDCAKCGLNKFGSAEDGKGKACKQKRRIYVLRQGEQLPIIMTLPTGSLGEFSKYIMRLLNRGKKSNQIVTKFSLKKAQNSTGINYSQAVFAVDRDLTSEEKECVSKMTEQIKTLAGKVEVVEEQE